MFRPGGLEGCIEGTAQPNLADCPLKQTDERCPPPLVGLFLVLDDKIPGFFVQALAVNKFAQNCDTFPFEIG